MEPIEQPRSKPTAFPKPPKSALFNRLEAFLPVLANENKKLEEAIACGEGDRHNIEIAEEETEEAEKKANEEDSEEEDSEEEREEDSDVDMDGGAKPAKAPVIEMNFALGLMEDGALDSDSDSDSEDDKDEIDLAASIAAARQTGGPQQTKDGEKEFQLNLSAPKPQQQATRPLIQELN